MTVGQYLILPEAIRQLGGELRFRPEDYAAAKRPMPRMEVDNTDRVVLLRLAMPDPQRRAFGRYLCRVSVDADPLLTLL